MKNKCFCIADIHGGLKGLVQVLEKSGFDYNNDRLVCLGDVCDGWPESPGALEELLKIKDLVYIIGNHDTWAIKWFNGKMDTSKSSISMESTTWLMNGGKATKDAYLGEYDLIKKHKDFFENNTHKYFLDENNRLYVHAGISTTASPASLKEQTDYDLQWGRDFWKGIYKGRKWGDKFDEIYIGHTPTINYNDCSIPIRKRNVWNIDTGAGFDGRLTIINVDTKEIFQSDVLRELYPDHFGRNKVPLNFEKKYKKI